MCRTRLCVLTNNVCDKDLHIFEDQEERPNLLPHNHDIIISLEEPKHLADQGTFHDMVHLGRILRSEAVPAMDCY